MRYVYSCAVERVIDGDTCVLQIDLGFEVSKRVTVRLFGIDAPEMRGDDRHRGIVARDALASKIMDVPIMVETKKDAKGKFGRYLATLFDESGADVNEWMVKSGHARRYQI